GGRRMLIAALPHGRVVVAVSGGPDSTALLIALQEAGRDIVAAHYDHALRDGSDGVALQVTELCARLGVPLISERRAEPLPKGSLQAAARQLRYAFLERARIAADAHLVATAHTADDVVEGVALHLMRGSGIAGFRGMPARRGHYVRPLLGFWRSEVREFLRRRGVVAYDDPANLEPRFARVRARLFILPALERDRPGILRRFHAAATAASRWYDTATAQAAAAIGSGPLTPARLPASAPAFSCRWDFGGPACACGRSAAGGPASFRTSSSTRGCHVRIETVGRLFSPVRGSRGSPVLQSTPTSPALWTRAACTWRSRLCRFPRHRKLLG